MNGHWVINTHGNPLGAVQDIVKTIWSQAELDGMLLPTNGAPDSITRPRLVQDMEELDKVNPFKPVMTLNSAQLVPEMLRDAPDKRYGVMLRPCELRALNEMAKVASFEIDQLLTISVDCLGTLPLEEFQWRAERKKVPGGLTGEALQFARQGGILAYRYRSACQVCLSPEAEGADININVLGIPVRQTLLVETLDPKIAKEMEIIAAGTADEEMVRQHKRVVARLNERHQTTMDRLSQNLAEFLPKNVEDLVQQLGECGDCQNCVDVCPICSVLPIQRDDQNLYSKEDVVRWLVSCAGCGMCEQSCESHLPLSTIFGHIREQLTEEFNYLSGQSPDTPPPIL